MEGSNGKPSKSKILYSSHTSPDKKSTLSAAAAAAAEEEETEERKRGRKIRERKTLSARKYLFIQEG